MIEQAHHIRMHVSYRVGDYREEGDVLGSVWLCVLAVLGVGFVLEELAPCGDAALGVVDGRVRGDRRGDRRGAYCFVLIQGLGA